MLLSCHLVPQVAISMSSWDWLKLLVQLAIDISICYNSSFFSVVLQRIRPLGTFWRDTTHMRPMGPCQIYWMVVVHFLVVIGIYPTSKRNHLWLKDVFASKWRKPMWFVIVMTCTLSQINHEGYGQADLLKLPTARLYSEAYFTILSAQVLPRIHIKVQFGNNWIGGSFPPYVHLRNGQST